MTASPANPGPTLVGRRPPLGAGRRLAPAAPVSRALLVVLVAMAIPSTASIQAGPLRLSPYRIVMLFAFVPMLLLFASRRFGRFLAADFLVLFYASWAWLSLTVHHGPEVSLESGGIYFLESVGAYLFGRCLIRDSDQFGRALRYCWLGLCLLLPFVLLECLTGKHLIQSVFAALQGRSFSSAIDTRAGFHRAFGPLDHPILWGVVSAAFIAPVWYYSAGPGDRVTVRRIGRTLVPFLCAVTSLSSGAVTVSLVQIGLIAWERATRRIRGRWWILTGGIVLLYIFIDMLSNRSGIRVFLSYLTFSPGTAYNRLIIWEWGFHHNAMEHPLFGIGMNDWVRPSWMHSGSMDNFWLVVAVTFGLPASIALITAFVLSIRGLGRRAASADPRRLGLAFSMIAIGLAGATVHFWNGSFVFVMFMLGCAAAVGASPAGAVPRRPAPSRLVLREAHP